MPDRFVRHPRHPSRRIAARALLSVLLPIAAAGACGGDPSSGPTTGQMALAVTGLAPTIAPALVVAGPGNFRRDVVSAADTLSGLPAGAYDVTAAPVSTDEAVYVPLPLTQRVVVAPTSRDIPPALAQVRYSQATAVIDLRVDGLPAGTAAAVTVTGPAGYTRTVTRSDTLFRLVPGNYTIAAASLAGGPRSFVATPGSAVVQLRAGERRQQTVAYRDPADISLNLVIDGVYLTQSIQTYTNSVPLVADRAALLRVFVRANEANNGARPTVRARFSRGATLLETLTLTRGSTSTPTTVSEASLSASWNATVPAALLQPGVSLTVDVDAEGEVAESSERDNEWPTRLLDVRAVPPFDVRLVPVRSGATGLTGNVTAGNAEQFLSVTRRIFPLAAVTATVRDVYTTSGEVMADDSSWSRVLAELNALRTAEGTGALYYGVAKVAYSSGIAGLGYVGLPTSMGWDYLPTSGTNVMAHELGHNFGRRHAPCGVPGSTDASYPFPNGTIGDWGYDATDGSLKSPTLTDIMGYCSSKWISAYTYRAVMNYRSAAAGWGDAGSGSGAAIGSRGDALASALAANVAPRPAVLVWGRIRGGRVTLEPAFQLVTRPSLPPAGGGAHTVRGVDASGAELFALSFDGSLVADAPDGDRHFAFAVPLDEAAAARFTELRVSGQGSSATIERMRAARGGATVDADATVRRVGGGKLAVRWDAALHPMVMVRDARTGRVLSFARGGATDVEAAASGQELDLVFSDRVRSARRRVRVTER